MSNLSMSRRNRVSERRLQITRRELPALYGFEHDYRCPWASGRQKNADSIISSRSSNFLNGAFSGLIH